jgi:hypothetical protein
MKGLTRNCAARALCTALGVLGVAITQSNAQVITLTDNNSVAEINTSSQSGMFNWSVQGRNELFQQWFWYGVGSGALASIDHISPPTIVTTGTRQLTATYANANFSVGIDYLLSGGSVVGPGQTAVSGIGETIRIINTSGTVLPFHFYQYSDFDLGGPPNNSVQLGMNLRGLFNEALQSNPNVALTETVTTPGANHGEVGFYASTLNRLNGGTPLTLNDNAGPVGPGDVTWALEWDFNIDPGSSVLISKDKFLSVLIPEPSTFAFVALGLALCVFRKPRA